MFEEMLGPERALRGVMSVARLVEEPRLARVYSYLIKAGVATIDEIVEGVNEPRTTVYADTRKLVELGVVTRDETHKTHSYRAIPVTLTAEIDGEEFTITPTLIAALAQAPRDQDLNLILEQHGPGKLAAALTYAIPYAEGRMSERVAARELNLQPAFAIAALHALRNTVVEMRDADPHFDNLRNAHAHPQTDKD